MPDLKITIGADIGNTVQQVGAVTKGMENLSTTATKTSTALSKMPNSVNSAANSLQNLGRVVQDAPFGFIGIQNNLNPLLESFQRLKAETGSTGGAFKALASSLMGAGGLGLALSLVSSAFLLYQQYAQGATKETKETEKAIQLSISTYDRFVAELDKVTNAMAQEAAKVSILFSALSENNIGLRERKGILEQLNQISPGYLGNLDKEKAAYNDIARAVFNYTESLAKSAEIKALLPQVDALFKGLINAQIELNQLRRFQSKEPGTQTLLGLSDEDFEAEESRLLRTIKNFGNQIKQAKAGLESFAGGPLSLSEILFGKTPELDKVTEKVKKKIESIGKITLHPELIEVDSKKIKEAAEKLERDFQNLLGKHPMKTKIEIQASIDRSNIQTVSDAFVPISDQWSVMLAQGVISYQDFVHHIEQLNQDMADSIHHVLDKAISSIGESIGESIATGANLFETIFGNLFKVIGSGLKQLGEAMVGLGTVKIALEKFELAPGIGTVIAGIAAIALGTLLQKAMPHFAQGVENFGGGFAVVGERGPELVRLPSGSDVIPNHRLGGIGAANNIFIPDVRIRGNDLLVVFNRAQATSNRNN